ncbi:hypothetical protein DPMN_112233 [Dreissena polymorpha]|uniref:Uncharacterized protein n=1 Tax=Dreissena polymorpha TaxID=45954 RepID=A0A9D4KFZ5_DREPO|nr:hypothetical protein DPMN_112233 [Dreissena polymorpha]
MAAVKRGRVQKKLHSVTAPSILSFISRRDQSPKSIVGSLLSYIVSKTVESKISKPKHRGITQKQISAWKMTFPGYRLKARMPIFI